MNRPSQNAYADAVQPESLPRALREAQAVGSPIDVADGQQLPSGWVSVPADTIDVAAPASRIGTGWSPTSVVVDYRLLTFPVEGDIEAAAVRENATSFAGKGTVRPLVRISEHQWTVGLCGSTRLNGREIWSDTQYLFDGIRMILRQHTFGCEADCRQEHSVALEPFRTWLLDDARSALAFADEDF